MMCWSTILSAYKIRIKHISDNKNVIADILSRRFEKSEEEEPQQAIPNHLINKTTFQVDKELPEKFKELSLEEKQQILFENHDDPMAEHPGIKETTRKVLLHHYWPDIKTFITNYVKECKNCQKYKINCHPFKPPL